MKNEPILFINTVYEIIDGKENQTYFDSRRINKNKAKLESLKERLFNKEEVICFIKTQNTIYEGVLVNISEKTLEILCDSDSYEINFNDIMDISF